jgi:acyl carrier protein
MPTRDECAAALLKAAIDVLGEVPEGISDDSSLSDDLGADSLDLLEIVMVLEDTLDFTAQEGDFSDLTTVGDAVDVLVKIAP